LNINGLQTEGDAKSIARQAPRVAVGRYSLYLRPDRDNGIWQVCWHQKEGRVTRRRSTGTTDIEEARAMLLREGFDPANERPAPQEDRFRLSMVYFIAGDVGAIKIGISCHVEGRLIAIQTGSPIPLRILAVTPGSYREERAYHQRFAAHRLHGEWFDRHPEIMDEIDRLRAVQVSPVEAA
jgi:hypothetical protein